VIDLGRVRRALAALDAAVARYPRLRDPTARERLAMTLDDDGEEGDRGSDGSEEED
jgi:hypothetical protein